jgi:putative PIN family toxin of toxin-antitoxin system
MRLVLDTSILIAALRSRNGAAAAILDLVLARKVTLLMDYRIACEYRDVALRAQHIEKSNLSAEEIEHLIVTLEGIAIPVEILWRHRPLSIDPNDDLILDLAINGYADAIVTNNLRHLHESAKPFGISVFDARTLLITMQ